MSIFYKLEHFEGPLELLLHLIEKNKVSIWDIPIVTITEQYLAYVSRMETEDMGVVSEFLVMASALLDIKARMLLPAREEEEDGEEDPRTELAARLLEYRMFRRLAASLRGMEEGAGGHLYKEPTLPKEVARYEPPADLDQLLQGLTPDRLCLVFRSVMKRQKDRADPLHGSFGRIAGEPVSLVKRIASVMEYARNRRRFHFRQLFAGRSSRTEVVVSFLAVLELTRMGQIRMAQAEPFGDMEIELTDEGARAEKLNLEGLEAL